MPSRKVTFYILTKLNLMSYIDPSGSTFAYTSPNKVACRYT